MATATAEAPETVRAPFFTTKVITFIAFTATLICRQFPDWRRRLGVLDRLEGLRLGAVRLYLDRRRPFPGLFLDLQQIL